MKRIVQLALSLLMIFSAVLSQEVFAVEKEQEKIYTPAQLDVQPTFDGQPAKTFKQYLQRNVKLPPKIKAIKGLDTTLIVSFVVEKDGTTSSIEVIGSPRKEFADTLIYRVENCNLWRSGEIGGEAVRSEVKILMPLKNSKDVLPKFQRGDVGDFRRWVMSNIKFPEEALKNGLPGGTVKVSFVIDKNGMLDNIEILETPHMFFSEEVERVLKSSPRWSPATRDSIPVRVKLTIPINFSYR